VQTTPSWSSFGDLALPVHSRPIRWALPLVAVIGLVASMLAMATISLVFNPLRVAATMPKGNVVDLVRLVWTALVEIVQVLFSLL